jgi:ABC-type dipeptide/oligopeptide/nickel transport system permease subunit
VLLTIDESEGPWLPLGSDPLGRDVLARLLYGARISLAVAALASLGALALGILVGAPAGFAGGRLDAILMGFADFVLLLPAIYVALALRSALPLVLSVGQVFWTLVLVFAALGWPVAARGVRAVIALEKGKGVRRSCVLRGGTPVADSATPSSAGDADLS